MEVGVANVNKNWNAVAGRARRRSEKVRSLAICSVFHRVFTGDSCSFHPVDFSPAANAQATKMLGTEQIQMVNDGYSSIEG